MEKMSINLGDIPYWKDSEIWVPRWSLSFAQGNVVWKQVSTHIARVIKKAILADVIVLGEWLHAKNPKASKIHFPNQSPRRKDGIHIWRRKSWIRSEASSFSGSGDIRRQSRCTLIPTQSMIGRQVWDSCQCLASSADWHGEKNFGNRAAWPSRRLCIVTPILIYVKVTVRRLLNMSVYPAVPEVLK